MKSFLDNKLEKLTNRYFNRTAGKTSAPIREIGPSIYEVIQAVKEVSKERPDDKGLKYSIAQLHFFGRNRAGNNFASWRWESHNRRD